MSKQSKHRNKRLNSGREREASLKGAHGASGVPSRQPAPPWVKNGERKPAAVKTREAELKAAQAKEAAERAAQSAKREAAHA